MTVGWKESSWKRKDRRVEEPFGGGLLKQRGKERAIKLRGKGFAGNTRQKERLQASFVESRERRGETQKFYPAAF